MRTRNNHRETTPPPHDINQVIDHFAQENLTNESPSNQANEEPPGPNDQVFTEYENMLGNHEDSDAESVSEEPVSTTHHQRPKTALEMQKIFLSSLPHHGLPRPQLYIESIYKLESNECGTAQSSQKHMFVIWQYFYAYCQEIHRPMLDETNNFGLRLYSHQAHHFTTTSSPQDANFDRALVRGFYQYLLRPDIVTVKTTFQYTNLFFNANLKAEYLARLKAAGNRSLRLGNTKIGEDNEIRNFVKQGNRAAAKEDILKQLDLLANVDNRITEEETHRLLEMALGKNIDPSGQVSKLSTQKRLIFGASFVAARGTMRRAQDFYSQKRKQLFTEVMRGAGPHGSRAYYMLVNEGKRNKHGKHEYTATLPNVDPILDDGFWQGALLLHSLLVRNIDLPDVEDWQSMFDIPTYQSPVSLGVIGPKEYGKIWAAFFIDANIHVAKLTHIWRKQAQQEMDSAGLTLVNIGRMTGHATQGRKGKETSGPTTAQLNHYVTNPPVDCVVQRANGDPDNPISYRVDREQCTDQHLETLLDSIPRVRDFRGSLKRAHRAFDQCQSYTEKTDKRLYTCTRMAERMVLDMKAFYKVMASRPRDPLTLALRRDSEPLFRQTGFQSLYDLLSIPNSNGVPVIESDTFTRLCSEINFTLHSRGKRPDPSGRTCRIPPSDQRTTPIDL